MRIDSAFPSEFLKASDCEKPMTVSMTIVKMMTLGKDEKPVLFFKGQDKGLVLNKTNAKTISAVFGDNTDDWHGGEIVLYETMVPFQGRDVAAIRVRHSPKKSAVTHDPMKDVKSGPPKKAELPDDDIPF